MILLKMQFKLAEKFPFSQELRFKLLFLWLIFEIVYFNASNIINFVKWAN